MQIKEYKIKIYKKDFLYKSFWFQKLLNKFIKCGKKWFIENLIYKNLKLLNYVLKKKKIFFFFELLEIFKPALKVSLQNFKKQVFRIPKTLKFLQQYRITLNWIYLRFLNNKKKKITNKVLFIKEFTEIFLYHNNDMLMTFQNLNRAFLLQNKHFIRFRPSDNIKDRFFKIFE